MASVDGLSAADAGPARMQATIASSRTAGRRLAFRLTSTSPAWIMLPRLAGADSAQDSPTRRSVRSSRVSPVRRARRRTLHLSLAPLPALVYEWRPQINFGRLNLRRHMSKRLLALAGALCLLALPAFSQTNPTGTMSGKVADQQGLAVPGAVVTAQSPALQGSRTATSSANGDFILPFLPPGDYTVTVDMPGFRSTKQTARVTIAQTTTIDLKLALSSVTETIEVTAVGAADFGQKAQVATNFKQELVEKLPLARTFQAAALLTPGVQATGPQGAMAISGAMSYQNLFMINGVVVQDNIRSTPYNLFIEDALQETTTSTAAVSAEYGRFGGGVV